MATFFSGFQRKKTMSESSDVSGVEEPNNSTKEEAGQNYLYDIDGKFAYSYYDHQRELYDIDGKHKYKYFNQMRRLPTASAAIETPSITKKAQDTIGSSVSPCNSLNSGYKFMYDIEGKIPYTVFDANNQQIVEAKKP